MSKIRVTCAHCGEESWMVETEVPGTYEFKCKKSTWTDKYITKVTVKHDGTIETKC